MTVSSDLSKITYAGNGTTTVFPVNYYFLANSHLQVVLIAANGTETVQTLTTNYTVSGAGNPAGGSVTMLVAPPSGTSLVIQRDVPATQETDYLANDPFPAESHERALDKLTMLVQQNERDIGRSLKIPLSAVPTTSTELPIPVGNKLLAWNSNASAVINLDPSDVITVTGQQNSYADVFTGNGSTVNFTLTRNPGSVFNIDVSINGSTQVPNVDYILSGTTLTFTSAPPGAASKVLARYSEVFTLNDADAANVRYLPAGTGAQLTNVQAKLRETVSVKDFGAVGDGLTDDTAAIQAAIDHVSTKGGIVYFPPSVYRGKGIVLKAGVTLQGDNKTSKIRFLPSDPATDATSYCILWQGSYSAIRDMTIDGQNPNLSGNPKSVGNGVLISADARGFHREFVNCEVQFFAGYLASPTGGTYGINANYDADDIRDPSTLAHKLTGGNCIVVSPVGSGSELVMEDMTIGRCDGYGFEEGFNNDCKYSNIYISNCLRAGLSNTRSTANTQYLNFKVYTCRALNVTSLATSRIIPYTGESVDLDAAIIITGTRHELTNIEAQENGSNGFRLGTVSRSLSNSNLNIIADGNGGIDSSASPTVNANYARDGVVFANYFNLKVDLIADDFRASLDLGRQKRGVRILAPVVYSSGSTLYWGLPYYIADNSGGADFTPLQLGYASPSNTVGTIFYITNTTATVPAFTWGTGNLESLNTALTLNAIIENQTEQRDGISDGYSISNDRGLKTTVFVNGKSLINQIAIEQTILSSQYAYTVTKDADTNACFAIDGNGKLRFSSGAGFYDANLGRISANALGTDFSDSFRAGSGAWDGGHLLLGTYHLWVDATGDLRIKSSAPSSDTDGTVVGTQT